MPTEQLQAFMNEWTLSRDAARQAAAALRSDQVMFPATVDQLQGVAHNHPELASSRQQSPAAKMYVLNIQRSEPIFLFFC